MRTVRTRQQVACAGVLICLTVLAGLLAGQTAGSPSGTVTDAYFVEELYPILEETQCRLCHSNDGVASGSRLKFPPESAEPADVRSFGRDLRKFVDRREPRESLLFRKPTNRLDHSGGERISRGSAQEDVLLTWVRHLTTFPEVEGAEETSLSHSATIEPAAPSVVRRLTHTQYNNTVRDLLGDLTRPATQFPAEDYIHGFKNQTGGQSMSLLLAEAYSKAAEKLAENAFLRGDQQELVPCKPVSESDVSCAGQFIQEFGRRAFRRPLTTSETEKCEALFQKAMQQQSDFFAGARAVVETMLQSPHFLFRVERGSDGPWHSFEVASRLSYFLWDTMPDDALLRQAEQGDLTTAEQIESTARRMLRDSRARPAMEEFLSQWLRFDRLLSAIRDRRLYPNFNSRLTSLMAEETRRLFNHLVWDNGNFMELFSADYSFLNADLAELYGLPAPPTEFARVEFPSDMGRAGILGQPMFLTLTSKPMDTSPTERGLYIREHFLCQNVPPPPPGANTTLPPITDEQRLTNRGLLEMHLTNPSCASCHRLIDPIGYGFEQYDALGRFREQHLLTVFPTRDELLSKRKTKPTEYELPIDPSGEVRGIAVKGGVSYAQFSSPKELGLILAAEPTCQKCVVRQVFRYALGRPETTADAEAIDQIFRDFQDSRFLFQELIISLVRSEPFLRGLN